MVFILVGIFFFILYASLIFYYWYHWKHIPSFEAQEQSDNFFLSVVIAARNEEENLPILLKAILAQSYPKHLFEVIIVDDYSSDNTQKNIQPFLNEFVRVIYPALDKNSSSKKKAIQAGVIAAKGKLIVITDADCRPGPEWLQTITNFYRVKNALFIAAPVKFNYELSALQIFQALDFMVLQGITAASVSANFHSMCNGANLAYTKQAFLEVDGFKGIDKISSGDDMLLMYKIWKKHAQSVHYLKSKKAIVSTQPMLSWKEFFMQRRRWASKTLYYDDKRVLAILAFVYFFNLLFIVLIIASFFNPFYWWMVVGYWISKTIIEIPFVASVAKFYNEKKLLFYFPFFQPLHIFYTVSVGLLSQLGKYEWKGRRLK
ncbi:MAG: glycosyltransferase [Bacteroidota bacterium]|nr:glycosyltransferase [Bacteroidota bacterium]